MSNIFMKSSCCVVNLSRGSILMMSRENTVRSFGTSNRLKAIGIKKYFLEKRFVGKKCELFN